MGNDSSLQISSLKTTKVTAKKEIKWLMSLRIQFVNDSDLTCRLRQFPSRWP